MLTEFPKFKHLELSDKKAVEKFTSSFDPYSDFNFTSLWSWDTDRKLSVSILNGNMVVKMPDYVKNQQIVTFIGDNKVDETIIDLLDYNRTNKLGMSLKLIPEITIDSIKKTDQFEIKEDSDNNDYILSVDEIVNLKGNKFKKKRHQVNRFESAHPGYIVDVLDLDDSKTQKEIRDLTTLWTNNSNEDGLNRNEIVALERILHSSKHLGVEGIGCYVDNSLVAYGIFEKLDKYYGIAHFEKANTHYQGIYAFINQAQAKHLKLAGCEFYNIEQDLAVPGLKRSKQDWKPIKFLKKFTVSLR